MSKIKIKEIKAVRDVEEAVIIAATEALKATCQGTFSVGGALIDLKGNVLHRLHNNVVKNNKIFDPTAHGERQMIDWYFENREALTLPAPEECILITSLDPCAMCTGSILESGFNCVVISANDTYAGINYDEMATFPTLDGTAMQAVAEEKFCYPEVVGETCFTREASGGEVPDTFNDKVISEQTLALTSTVFSATLSEVQGKINADFEPNDLINPITLQPGNRIYDALKEMYPQALTYTAQTSSGLATPDVGLAAFLIEAANQDKLNGGEGNSVAFLDYFGNLLMCFPGNQGVSGIQTPFMITTRNYAQLRYTLEEAGETDTRKYLCHPKYGTFVYAKSIEINPRGLVDLGAFGSTMEGQIPDTKQLQYCVERVPQAELQAFADKLPPFYSNDESVNIKITQVMDFELIQAIQDALPQS